MKHLLAALLAAACLGVQALEESDPPQSSGYAGPFGERHVQEKRLERLAIGRRVQQNLSVARNRDEVQYGENRRRCQAALQIAELCGRFAGTFYCDEKGFQAIAPHLATKPPALNNSARYRMERCALDASARHR